MSLHRLPSWISYPTTLATPTPTQTSSEENPTDQNGVHLSEATDRAQESTSSPPSTGSGESPIKQHIPSRGMRSMELLLDFDPQWTNNSGTSIYYGNTLNRMILLLLLVLAVSAVLLTHW